MYSEFQVKTIAFFSSTKHLCENLSNAAFDLYADDTMIYCLDTSVIQTQAAFDDVQAHKYKLMLISNGKEC